MFVNWSAYNNPTSPNANYLIVKSDKISSDRLELISSQVRAEILGLLNLVRNSENKIYAPILVRNCFDSSLL